MAQPQKTPEEGKEIETWQYSNITEAIFGDHTRIHQGNVINISGSESQSSGTPYCFVTGFINIVHICVR